MLTEFSCPQNILSITISSTNISSTTLTGGRAFCSVECKSKQMVMDEDESFRRDQCSFMAVKVTKPDSPAPMFCGGHHRHCQFYGLSNEIPNHSATSVDLSNTPLMFIGKMAYSPMN
ncbi:hypothetical protein YC2023_016200 [Brassica napus]